MDKFIILSNQRSGSTLLVFLLDSHFQIQCWSELFQKIDPNKLNKSHYPKHYKISWVQFYESSPTRQFLYKFRKSALVNKYLDNIYTNTRDKNIQAIGFKLIYSQLEAFPQVKDYIKKNNIKVIHCIRRNSLKTIISLETAKARRKFATREPLETIPITLKCDNLIDRLNKMSTLIKNYSEIRSHTNSYYEIFYEDLISNKETESRKLLDFLGISDYRILTTDLLKMNPDSIEDIVDNYEELKDTLQDSEYESFLLST